jgi:hypothetical protein
MHTRLALLASLILAGGSLLPMSFVGSAYADPRPGARDSLPVVLTGAQIPSWSRVPAEGVANPYPSGATDGVRDAHNGR